MKAKRKMPAVELHYLLSVFAQKIADGGVTIADIAKAEKKMTFKLYLDKKYPKMAAKLRHTRMRDVLRGYSNCPRKVEMAKKILKK